MWEGVDRHFCTSLTVSKLHDIFLSFKVWLKAMLFLFNFTWKKYHFLHFWHVFIFLLTIQCFPHFNTNLYGSTSNKKHHLHMADDQLWNAAFLVDVVFYWIPAPICVEMLQDNINGSKYIKILIKLRFFMINGHWYVSDLYKMFIIDLDGEMVV